MYNDDKKSITILVEVATHQWLVDLANLDGERIGIFTGLLVDMLSSAFHPESKEKLVVKDDSDVKFNSDDIDLFWDWHHFIQKKRRETRIFQAAAIYASDPTEDGAERLARMCVQAGLDYTEVKANAEKDPFSSIIAESRRGTKFGECLQWLPRTLVECGGEVETSTIQEMGETRGFTPSMLDRVKRAVNQDLDTPSILSVKTGKCWTWRIDEHEQEQQQQQQPNV